MTCTCTCKYRSTVPVSTCMYSCRLYFLPTCTCELDYKFCNIKEIGSVARDKNNDVHVHVALECWVG